jgi:flavin reductase (DIM6/NTAB) family NADH-FMN oxidoreductase RutF
VEIRNITLSPQGHGLIYFKRRFHPVMMDMEVAVATKWTGLDYVIVITGDCGLRLCWLTLLPNRGGAGRNITLSPQGHGLIYFKRRFHPVMMDMEVAV